MSLISNKFEFKRVWWILLILIISGFFLRFYEFRWGLPGFYVSDTQIISEAADMGNALLQKNWDFFAEPVKYPFIIPYLLLFANGVFFVLGMIGGIFSSAADFSKFISLHQEIPFLIARFFSILAGTAIIPLTFFTARLLAKRFGCAKPDFAAVISSFFAAFSLLLFQFSRLEKSHVIVGFFTLLSYFLYLRFIERPSRKNGFWLGVVAGLAAGTLHNGVLAALFLILPLLFFLFKKRNFLDYRFIYWGLLSAAILIFLSYPFFFLSPLEALKPGADFGINFDISLSGGKHNVSSFGGLGFYTIFQKFLFYDPAIFVLTIISIIFLGSARKRFARFLKADAFGILAYSIVFLLVFGLFDSTSGRFLTPLILLMIVMFGVVLSEVLRRRLGIIFLSLLCLFSFTQVLRMAYLIGLPDTRALATQWVGEHLTEEDVLLINAQNVATPLNKESILWNTGLGGPDTRRDELLLSLPDEDYPKDAKNILRSWQLEIADYQEFTEKNNINYILVSLDKKRDSSDPLLIFAEKNFKLKEVFSPSNKHPDFLSPSFPDEFSSPIIDLWRIERMGPEIRIYSKP